MKKIRLSFANFQIEFADRDLALRRVEEWAERGMTVVHVVYGPEGCGKTAWLRQSAVLLRELGFHVIYVDALHRY
ncbi:MAG: ATP-binding protein, partial [Nanopusillaceae archaeon]